MERLTDAELERRYYAARRELDAMDSYGEKYDLELVGLRVQRAMGTPYAADAIDEVKNARKGIMQVLPVGKMSPHDHVRDTQMQNDPVVRLRYDLSGSMQKNLDAPPREAPPVAGKNSPAVRGQIQVVA
jgi:hypothetical protein